MVVTGDTNTRYARSADTIASFVANNGLTDAWVKLDRGGVAPAAGGDALMCDESAITNSCEVLRDGHAIEGQIGFRHMEVRHRGTAGAVPSSRVPAAPDTAERSRGDVIVILGLAGPGRAGVRAADGLFEPAVVARDEPGPAPDPADDEADLEAPATAIMAATIPHRPVIHAATMIPRDWPLGRRRWRR